MLTLFGALIVAAPAFAQTPDVQELQATIAAQAQEIERLRATLAERDAEIARLTAPDAVPAADGAVWRVAILNTPDDPRAPLGAELARYAADDDVLTLGDAADAAKTPAGAVTVRRESAFVADAEGFHGLGVEIGFPDIGLAGYLGGFICEAAMTIDGRQTFRRTLRRPYGRSAATADVTSTERLAPGRYAVVQQVACRPDGRHGADAEPALRAVTLRSLVRRPSERVAQPATAGDFAP